MHLNEKLSHPRRVRSSNRPSTGLNRVIHAAFETLGNIQLVLETDLARARCDALDVCGDGDFFGNWNGSSVGVSQYPCSTGNHRRHDEHGAGATARLVECDP